MIDTETETETENGIDMMDMPTAAAPDLAHPFRIAAATVLGTVMHIAMTSEIVPKTTVIDTIHETGRMSTPTVSGIASETEP
jgi:hypothetical protein